MKVCNVCTSPDVVSYHGKEPADSFWRLAYPDALRCVDCGAVMPMGVDRPRPRLADLCKSDGGRGFAYVPVAVLQDGDPGDEQP